MTNPYQVDPTGGRRVVSRTKNMEHIRRVAMLATVLGVSPLEVIMRAVKLLADTLDAKPPEPPQP